MTARKDLLKKTKKKSVRLREDVRRYIEAKKAEAREPEILDEWLETLYLKYDDRVDDEVSRQLKEHVDLVDKDLRYSLSVCVYDNDHRASIRKCDLIRLSEGIVRLYVKIEKEDSYCDSHRKAKGIVNALPASSGANTAWARGHTGSSVRMDFTDTSTHAVAGKKHNHARILRIQRLIKELDKCTEVLPSCPDA